MQKQKKIEILPPPSVGTEDELSQIITTAALLDCDKISSLCLIVVQLLLFYPDLSERVMVRRRWEICLLFRPNIYPLPPMLKLMLKYNERQRAFLPGCRVTTNIKGSELLLSSTFLTRISADIFTNWSLHK